MAPTCRSRLRCRWRVDNEILEQTKPLLLLTRRSLSSPPLPGSTALVDLDDWKLFEDQATTNPPKLTTPENLAYVVFTSGSTGKPKGVMVPHRGVQNYREFLVTRYRLTPGDTVLQIPPLSFDASARDLLCPLTVGARVVLMSSEDARDPEALLESAEEQRVTAILSIVGTMLQAVLAAAEKTGRRLDTLRIILTSGERLPMSACYRSKNVFPNASVFNQYGPTECTMTSTSHCVTLDEEVETAKIGRPITNAEIVLLDRVSELVPVGAKGHLHIAGRGLVRGYLNQPAATAERFLPNSFDSMGAGGTMYQTGDVAKYGLDGVLEFIGRLDRQVNVRGQRVEPGEVENVLLSHWSVRDAFVMLRRDGQGEPILVAYVVPTADAREGYRELHSFLQDRLPESMVPSSVVLLESMPTTPNGKVDQSALPEPRRAQLVTREAFTEPHTDTEKALAVIWCELLGLERVGSQDDFFELGGHSLLATQVISRVRERLDVELPLREFFVAPRIVALAEVVESRGKMGHSTLPSICPISREDFRARVTEQGSTLKLVSPKRLPGLARFYVGGKGRAGASA